MSRSGQAQLGKQPPKPHLTAEQPENCRLGLTKAREWYCRECQSRVTGSADGAGEYGHKVDCPHHYQAGGGDR